MKLPDGEVRRETPSTVCSSRARNAGGRRTELATPTGAARKCDTRLPEGSHGHSATARMPATSAFASKPQATARERKPVPITHRQPANNAHACGLRSKRRDYPGEPHFSRRTITLHPPDFVPAFCQANRSADRLARLISKVHKSIRTRLCSCRYREDGHSIPDNRLLIHSSL